MESQRCGTKKIKVNRLPERRMGAAMGAEAGRPGHPRRWGWRCEGTAPAQAGLPPTAYKEKMKELSVLSLICSCFYSQPHPNTVYQYGGECARPLPCQGLLPPDLATPSRGVGEPPLGCLLERGPCGEGPVLGVPREQPHPSTQPLTWVCARPAPSSSSPPEATICFCPADMEVKQLDKRASGQSFEVILKSPSDLSPESPMLSSPPKRKDTSLEELQKRLEAAEGRRKVRGHPSGSR